MLCSSCRGEKIQYILKIVKGIVFFDYKDILDVYKSLKGFHLEHECTEVYRNQKPGDSREMVSANAVISAIYQLDMSPIIRRANMCQIIKCSSCFSMKRGKPPESCI